MLENLATHPTSPREIDLERQRLKNFYCLEEIILPEKEYAILSGT